MAPETREKLIEALKGWKSVSREIAGFVIFFGFFSAMYMLMFEEVPAGNKDVMLLLLGVLAGSYKDVVGFLWGGSFGSEKKTEALAKKEGE